jgi:hypothetical protein
MIKNVITVYNMLKIVLLLTEKNPAAEKFGKLLVIRLMNSEMSLFSGLTKRCLSL